MQLVKFNEYHFFFFFFNEFNVLIYIEIKLNQIFLKKLQSEIKLRIFYSNTKNKIKN